MNNASLSSSQLLSRMPPSFLYIHPVLTCYVKLKAAEKKRNSSVKTPLKKLKTFTTSVFGNEATLLKPQSRYLSEAINLPWAYVGSEASKEKKNHTSKAPG